MSEGVIIAIIGAIGMIVAAFIGTRIRRRSREGSEQSTHDVVGRDKVGGDVVGGDKVEAHEHYHVGHTAAEQKSGFVYVMEKFFVFVFTAAGFGLFFGLIGMALAQEVGLGIGIVLGLIAGIVNAGSVKRTKGIM
jgi:hypothetical protein